MEGKSSEIIIKAGTCLLKDLLNFSQDYTFKIPEYQRPYIWNQENLQSLISDLEYHISQENEGSYYLGSILFYKNNSTFEVIDGQQRLTTILIIDYLANNDKSFLVKNHNNIKFEFNSPVSHKSILENKKFLQTQTNFLNLWNKVLHQLLFSVIVTNNEDESFAFFETQNNRGVKLSPVDFLKSYHLRELKSEQGKQIAFATSWDKNNKNQTLDFLYKKILWRNRSWKGGRIEFENNDLILTEFQKKTRPKNKKNQIKLYPNHQNKIAQYAKYNEDTGITIQTYPISLQIQPKDYPFTLRQPIEKGTGFFLYSEKYNDLYNTLFNKESKDKEILEFRKFYIEVLLDSGLSIYFTDFFQLCSLTYFDKFGNEELLRFAKYLDYLLGSYRITYDSIVERTPVKILRDNTQNLLDIITNSFLPEEVFEFLLEISFSEAYLSEKIYIDHRVKGRYKTQQLKYYTPNEFEHILERQHSIVNSTGGNHLSNKLQWIKR